ASGEVIGTPSYMAPEQAAGRTREVGPRSDVYSLGAVLYFALTGRPPFRSGSAIETMRQVVEEEPTPPSQLNPGVPRALESICLKCLRKGPDRRYQSAGEMADELDRFLAGSPAASGPAAEARQPPPGLRPGRVAAIAQAGLLALVVACACWSGR